MSYFDQLGPLARSVVREAPYEIDLGQALSELHAGWRKCSSDGDWISPTDGEKAAFLRCGVLCRKWS